MIDKIDQKIDIPGWWWSQEITDYSKIVEWAKKEKWGDKEAEQAQQKAAELLAQIEWTNTNTTKSTTTSTNNTPIDIHTTIQNLNRPEAEKWIENSYTTIENTIKNSKNEKWIAGFLGKVMNKILG